jgi:hypothetical protein
MPFKVGWWVFDNGQRVHDLHKTITCLADGWKNCEVIHEFKEDHIKPLGFINSLQAGTIINIKNISLTPIDSVHEFDYCDQIVENNDKDIVSTQSNELFGSRTDMWKYAMKLWKDEYSVKNRIFGKGFDYLPEYGAKFNNSKESYTYPHNPVISSFLYAGMLGGFFHIYFLLTVFWLFWKYRMELFPAFAIYFFVFFFTMFSGNSHFSVNLFAFLSFIPFIYRSYKVQVKDPQIGSF